MNDEVITSSSNPRIKYVQTLLKKADRRREDNVYVVEGVRMVLDAPMRDIRNVYVSSELLARDRKLTLQATDNSESTANAGDTATVTHFIDECKKNGIDVNVVSDKIIKSISQTVTPQGIVAVIGRRETADYRDKDRYLLLEDIQDPGNLGTLMRTAEAAGIDVVIMSRGCVDIYNPKTIRSTMGTIYRLPFVECSDTAMWQGIISEITSDRVKLYGGSLDDSILYTEVDFSGRCGIVIGNEGSGISQATLDMIDKVHIPMQGGIESLNASVAGSILMYEMTRLPATP